MNTRGPESNPYEARNLTKSELLAGDIHSYLSPKAGRLVRVDGMARIAQTLLLEFNPDVVAFTERPRLLTVGKQQYEICFWLRERSGRERMLLLVESGSSLAANDSRRITRQIDELIDAARAAHLPLELVMEREVLTQRSAIALAYRLLPLVQSALELANLSQLHTLILKALGQLGRMSYVQIEAALSGYQPADIGCVLAYLLHAGELTSTASDRFTRTTVFEVRP